MRGLLVLASLILLYLALKYLTPLLYPFLIGWLLAYAMNPLVNVLQRQVKFPRWLAVTVTLLLFFTALLTIVTAAVTRIVIEIINLSSSLNGTIEWWKNEFQKVADSPELQDFINRLNSFYQQNPDYQDTIKNQISDTAGMLANASSDLIAFFLNAIKNTLTSLPNVATIMVVVALAGFFISKDWYKHFTRISGWFSPGIRRTTSAVWGDLRKALFGYVRAQIIMISITAIVVISGLLILRVDNAVTIGLLVGLVDLLPYLGVGAVFIPWIAYTFLYGDWTLGVGMSILYIIILVARQMIEPKVLSSSVGLDPLPTLIGMFVGLKLMGFIGLIVGPVTLVILTAFHRANVFRDLYRFIMKGSR